MRRLRGRLWEGSILSGWCRDGGNKGVGLHADLVEGCVELSQLIITAL